MNLPDSVDKPAPDKTNKFFELKINSFNLSKSSCLTKLALGTNADKEAC